MNDSTPDGGIRASAERIYEWQLKAADQLLADTWESNARLIRRIGELSHEVDRLQMENAELRYQRDAARLARVIPDSDGYSNGEVWAS